MSDDALIGKADQLMRRHRSFVASAPAARAAVAAVDPDAEVPLLTEVVAAAAERLPRGALELRLAHLLAEQRQAMVREFECWLDEQLPQVVVSAMDGITDHLLALIAKRARAELLPRLEAIAASTPKSERAEQAQAAAAGAAGNSEPV